MRELLVDSSVEKVVRIPMLAVFLAGKGVEEKGLHLHKHIFVHCMYILYVRLNLGNIFMGELRLHEIFYTLLFLILQSIAITICFQIHCLIYRHTATITIFLILFASNSEFFCCIFTLLLMQLYR